MPKNYKANMTGTKDLENPELTNNENNKPQRFNRIWGRDYFALDGKSYKGGLEEADYDKLVDFLVEMWDRN